MTLTRAMIPPNILNQPIVTIEAWVNTFLAANIAGMTVRVHIESVNPQLVWTLICLNAGLPVPSNWWIE